MGVGQQSRDCRSCSAMTYSWRIEQEGEFMHYMKRFSKKNDEAVSPVVGVMLMLVVTIIIAAVVSGYAGGNVADPTYYDVASKKSGHAEVVQVTFDPAKVSELAVLEGECFGTVFDGASYRISRAGRYALAAAAERRAERREQFGVTIAEWLPPQVFESVEAAS